MKIIITILFTFLLSNFAFSADVIKVGIYELAPHMIVGEQKPHGSVIDYIEQEVVPLLGKNQKIVYSILPFSRILEELKIGTIDVAFMLSKNPDRELYIEYPSTSFFNTTSAIILNKSSNIHEIKTASQLKNLIIGHTTGSVLPDFIKNSEAKIEWVAGDTALLRNLERLKNNRIDAVFAPTITHAEYTINKHDFIGKFNILPLPGEKMELYYVFKKGIDDSTKNLFLNIKDQQSTYKKYLKLKITPKH